MQYFTIDAEDCSVHRLLKKVTEGFNPNSLVLVQSNGFMLEDNEATRSM